LRDLCYFCQKEK